MVVAEGGLVDSSFMAGKNCILESRGERCPAMLLPFTAPQVKGRSDNHVVVLYVVGYCTNFIRLCVPEPCCYARMDASWTVNSWIVNVRTSKEC